MAVTRSTLSSLAVPYAAKASPFGVDLTPGGSVDEGGAGGIGE